MVLAAILQLIVYLMKIEIQFDAEGDDDKLNLKLNGMAVIVKINVKWNIVYSRHIRQHSFFSQFWLRFVHVLGCTGLFLWFSNWNTI